MRTFARLLPARSATVLAREVVEEEVWVGLDTLSVSLMWRIGASRKAAYILMRYMRKARQRREFACGARRLRPAGSCAESLGCQSMGVAA